MYVSLNAAYCSREVVHFSYYLQFSDVAPVML